MRRRVYIRIVTNNVVNVRKTAWMTIVWDVWLGGLMKFGVIPGGGGTTPSDHCDDMAFRYLGKPRGEARKIQKNPGEI